MLGKLTTILKNIVYQIRYLFTLFRLSENIKNSQILIINKFLRTREGVHAVTLGSHIPKVEDRRTGLGAGLKPAAHPSHYHLLLSVGVGPQNVRVALLPGKRIIP